MSNLTPTAALKLCRDALRSILTTASKADADITAANALHATRQTKNATRATEPALDTERERFEAWARTCDGNCAEYDLQEVMPGNEDGDTYRLDLVQRDWTVWQARAALDKAGDGDRNIVAWAVYSKRGHVRIWFGNREDAVKWTQLNGLNTSSLTPLYRHPAPQASADDARDAALREAMTAISGRTRIVPLDNPHMSVHQAAHDWNKAVKECRDAIAALQRKEG